MRTQKLALGQVSVSRKGNKTRLLPNKRNNNDLLMALPQAGKKHEFPCEWWRDENRGNIENMWNSFALADTNMENNAAPVR